MVRLNSRNKPLILYTESSTESSIILRLCKYHLWEVLCNVDLYLNSDVVVV